MNDMSMIWHIRSGDGFKDIGRIIFTDGVVTETKASNKAFDPLRGMKGFAFQSVLDYAKKAGWTITIPPQ